MSPIDSKGDSAGVLSARRPIEDPFVVLQIEPTLDAGAIKRAYFAAIARTPPHRDAEAFRRVRTAYDLLRRPTALAAAFLMAPHSPEAALRPLRAHYDARLAEAAAQSRAVRDDRAWLDGFVATAATKPLAELIAQSRAGRPPRG